MKQILYILLFGLCLISCDDWLDVSPNSEIKSNELYETEEGFENALTGIYIGMTETESYGQYLTWHILEDLACQYDVASGNYEDLQNYNYQEDVANDVVCSIWLKQYNIIAQINKLLEALDENGTILNETLFNIIKGEALALRAYCHFDLLRLYGYGNLDERLDFLSKLTIPYVTSHTKNVTGQKTYTETFLLLEKDIEDALELLKSDPYYVGDVERPDGYNDVVSDPFIDGTTFKGRETRLNYGGVKALQARVLMWQGKKSEALTASEEVISLFNTYSGQGRMDWATESWGVGYSNEAYKDFIFYYELFFCLDVDGLYDNISDFYETTVGGKYNYDRLIHTEEFADDLFDLSGEGLSDLRVVHQYLYDNGDYMTIKIRKNKELSYTYFANAIPMIRISEFYLMAAECYATQAANLGKAIEYLNLLKEKRNIPDTYFIQASASQDDIESAIFKEYRKEFIQEGQLFYFYKRRGYETFPGLGSQLMTDNEYVLPYPDVETDLGGSDQQ